MQPQGSKCLKIQYPQIPLLSLTKTTLALFSTLSFGLAHGKCIFMEKNDSFDDTDEDTKRTEIKNKKNEMLFTLSPSCT